MATLTLEVTEQSAGFHDGPRAIPITRFPFRIGRQSSGEHGAFLSRLDLTLRDERPYSISRGHCLIERKGDAFFVRDCGSRLGTIVNGAELGAGASELTAQLQPGENELILGTRAGRQQYLVRLA